MSKTATTATHLQDLIVEILREKGHEMTAARIAVVLRNANRADESTRRVAANCNALCKKGRVRGLFFATFGVTTWAAK